MIKHSFRAAMRNSLRLASYEKPHLTNSQSVEWLIVERLGDDGSVLLISDTTPQAGTDGGKAPPQLHENNTIVGLLARPRHDETELETAQFLLVRHNMTGVQTPGNFFPADGCAVISEAGGMLRLEAFGRHAHSSGRTDARIIHHDIPRPAPSAQGAITWHFSAEQRPWRAAT